MEDVSHLLGAAVSDFHTESVPHLPRKPNPCETGGVIRCGLQAPLDRGPHGIPRGCQLSSQACNGGSSKRNCRIAQRIARTPKRARGTPICSSCSRNVNVWQVVSRHIQRRLNHRIRTGTPAQGTSITSTTTRPSP